MKKNSVISKFKQFISGDLLNNYSFDKRVSVYVFLFMILLLNMFITFEAQNTYRDLIRANNELKIIRTKRSMVNAEKVKVTRESYVIEELKKQNINLKRRNKPPIRINKNE